VRHDAQAPTQVKRFAEITAVLLLIALWADPVAGMVLTPMMGKVPGDTIELWANRFFAIEQPFTAALFVCLIGWLAHFTMREAAPLFRRAES
jgi:hypothetical protein